MMQWGSCRRAPASQVDHHSCLFSSCCSEEEEEAEEELEMELLHGGGDCSSMGNDMMIKQQQDLDSTCINAAEESENSLPGAGGGSVAGCNSKDHLHAVDGGGVHESKLCPRGHWRPAEDEKLRELVSQYGPQNWNLIAEKLQGRSGTRLLLHHDVLYQDFPAAGRHHCGCKSKNLLLLILLVLLVLLFLPGALREGSSKQTGVVVVVVLLLQVRAAGCDGSINWTHGSTVGHSQKKKRIAYCQRIASTATNGR